MAGNTIELEGLSQQMKNLERLMTTDTRMRENIQVAIRRVLKEVRKRLSAGAKEGLEMDSDPRKAYKAVRYAVYKRVLGGQVNILQRRKAGSPSGYQKPKKGLPKRGGNRWLRSDRTIALEGYEGMDRGFILRFLNSGTVDRMILSYTGRDNSRHTLRSGSTSNVKTRATGGNRGSISARNWFGSASTKELQTISSDFQNMIDDIINDIFI